MKKLAWKSIIKSMESKWKIVQEPTEYQIKKFFELEKPQQDWFRVSVILYPTIRDVILEVDKHNTVLRSELNTVYVELKKTLKKIKHVNRRINTRS